MADEVAEALSEPQEAVAHRDDVHLGVNYEWRDLAAIFNVISGTECPFVGSAWIPPALEISR